MGHNGAAAPRVCVPANVVSVLIGLLCAHQDITLYCSQCTTYMLFLLSKVSDTREFRHPLRYRTQL
ncbi:hypothetical protein EYR97_21640 [Alteromonas sp. KUL42]|nr:hypothetical protein EYR97_21640 [Alteromonas sp. KUL42]